MGQEQSGDVKDYHGVKNLSGADLVARMELLSAYRVMRVFPGSPASRSGLAAFEDFVVAVNQALVEGDGALSEILAAAEGTEVSLSVWNCVDEAVRNVKLTPAKWNGPGLLGAAVRFESIKGAMDSIWRVLDVLPNSPADNAGLVPRTDYIVGTTAEVFRTEATFSNLVRIFATFGEFFFCMSCTARNIGCWKLLTF